MRLNPFNSGDIRVEDQRGQGGRRGGGGFPGGGGGKIGLGTIALGLIAVFVFGADPMQVVSELGSGQAGSPSMPGQARGAADGPLRTEDQSCDLNAYSRESCGVLASLNRTWEPVFDAAGARFEQPKLVFYSQAGRSGCGAAQAAMGPFYCPQDEGIYLDTTFYDQLATQLGAGPGDFARAYVMAHEYGHHIQHLQGLDQRIRSLQQQRPGQANSLSVQLELQADCYAGVWAGRNRDLIEAGDFEEGMQAAQAIGDDTLMRGAGQRVSPESFTHGTSEQRQNALRLGLESGQDTACDRYMQA